MKKKLFITLWAILILSTSIWLTIESAQYYERFYRSAWRSFSLAILMESFLLTLAVSKFYKWTLRFIRKILIFLFFILIVGTASLYHVAPLLESIAVSTNQDEIKEAIRDEIENLKNDLSIFKGKQKLNAAIAANRRHELVKSRIEQVVKTVHSPISLYLDIAVLILLRIILQSANLLLTTNLGIYARKPKLKQIIKLRPKKEVTDIDMKKEFGIKKP